MTMHPSSDERAALVLRAQGGDREAFTALVMATQVELRAHLGALGCRAELSEEIIQTAFVTAYERLTQCRDPLAFTAWLKAIARHQLGRELTARRRHAALSGDLLAGLEAQAVEDGLADEVDPESQLQRLRGCLDRLDERSRRLIAERYSEARSAEDIAGAMQRSAVWVRVNLCRIRASLRQCVEGRA